MTVKKVNDYFHLVVSLFFIGVFLVAPVFFAEAQTEELNRTASQAGFGTQTDVPTIVGQIIRIVLGFMGLVLVILILVGGFRWMTSGGNEETIKNAKGLMSNAVIGLVIVILAYAIAWFVITRLQEISRSGGTIINN